MNRGFIAIGYIVVLLVAVVSISFYISARITGNSVARKRTFFKGTLDSLVLSVESSFKSQRSWNRTVTAALNKNSGADLEKCMNDPSFVCPMGEYPLAVYDDEGNVLVDSSSPSNGFDIDFKPCTTFGTTNPGSCFLRYEMTWQPECPATGTCYSPPVVVRGKLVLTPTGVAGAVDLNTDNYERNFRLR
ncbi:MAG: hypothetical protein JSU04_15305 [Bdellovibrionales bacterium]|nr:hypothetical protein [Bdellovibrionales bacterium]